MYVGTQMRKKGFSRDELARKWSGLSLSPKMPPTLPIDQLMNLIRLDGDLRTRLLPAQWAALDQLHQLYQVRPPPGVLLTGAAPAASLLTRAAAVLCLFCAGEPC